VDYSINPSEIYGWKGKHSLIKLNHQLETILEIETPFQDLRTLFIEDLDADGDQEIFYESGDLLLAFSGELDLLASFPKAAPGVNYTFRFTGPDNPIELGVQSGQNFYHFKFSHNKLYPFLPLLFIGLFIFAFLVSGGLSSLFSTLNIYLKFFKLCFYDSSDSILIVNYLGRIRFANANLKHLLGLPHQPVKGDTIQNILQGYPQILEKTKECFHHNQAVQETIVIKNQDEKREINLVAEPLHFPFKSGFSYLIKFSEITFDSTSQKVQIWSRAVQKMAHDIKTPLSTIMLNLKALQTRLEKITLRIEDRQELSGDMDMMRAELENIQVMTKNFLKFSNLEKPHFQVYDIRKIINDAIAKYQIYFSSDMTCQISIDDDVKPVWADPLQIEMVFHILLENSLAAMKGKGLISINASLAQYLEHSFSEFIEIEIADNGPGIGEVEKEKIFEPYYSTKQEGTGMGLAIARKIIEDHKGSIEVHSKPNFGAVFSFSIPAVTEEDENG
jgi:nitrogen-specific signal transduction histidine kinase